MYAGAGSGYGGFDPSVVDRNNMHYLSAEETEDWLQYLSPPSQTNSNSYPLNSEARGSDEKEEKEKEKEIEKNEKENVEEFKISDRGKEADLLSGRIVLPHRLTTKVEKQHKWNSEFQDLYEKAFFSLPKRKESENKNETEKIRQGDEESEAKAETNEKGKKQTEWIFKEKELVSYFHDIGCLYQDFIR